MTHFRQSGQRDPRRRRVLADLVLGRVPGADRPDGVWGRSSVESRSKNYGDAAFLDEQLRLTDLIPRRIGVYAYLFVAGAAVVAGLLALHGSVPRLAATMGERAVAAFDLGGNGTLAAWFSSTLLLLSAIGCVLVYTIRRHKKNDYQGHYRVWLWAAWCWLLLSIDRTAGLHEGFSGLMIWLTGTPLHGDGSAWWMIGYFFLLGGIGTRLALDMREYRVSLALFVSVGVCHAAAVAARLGWIGPTDAARAVLFAEGARLSGNLLLLLAVGLHARHVLLDAEGLLPEVEDEDPEEEPDDEEEEYEYDEDEVAAEEAVLFGHPVPVRPPRGVRKRTASRASAEKKPAMSPSDAFTAGMEAAENRVGRKLTKDEKKALRRRLEKQRLDRERRSA